MPKQPMKAIVHTHQRWQSRVILCLKTAARFRTNIVAHQPYERLSIEKVIQRILLVEAKSFQILLRETNLKSMSLVSTVP